MPKFRVSFDVKTPVKTRIAMVVAHFVHDKASRGGGAWEREAKRKEETGC